jgi:hypothetical protein
VPLTRARLLPFRATSERELQRELQLSRITYALAQEAVKVEQRRAAERVDQVLLLKVLNISTIGINS